MIYQDILLFLSNIFNKHHLNYFATGSLAVAFYGRERTSHDFDFKISFSHKESKSLILALSDLSPDYIYDKEGIISAIETKSMANILYLPLGFKIDLWFNKETVFDQERFKRKINQTIEGQKINFISPEDLILIKLDWYRNSHSDRHFEDAASVLQIQKNLDQKYLNLWAKKLKVENYLKQLKTFPVQEW